jgi:hypothetical protein
MLRSGGFNPGFAVLSNHTIGFTTESDSCVDQLRKSALQRGAISCSMVSGKSIESHIFDGGLVKLTRRNHRRASCLAGVCFSQTKLHLGIAATLGGMKTDPSMKETFEASKFTG